jgi:probable F420-dependent oxidoreductase
MTERLGVAISGPLDRLGAVARRCEDAGFDDLWVPETARSAYVQAAVALAATTRVRVGTSIALAFPRSPVITAMEARDLAELSGGRFVLGLGTQVKRVNELRFATPFEHPAPKMSELVDVLRATWRAFGGAPIDHRGRFYTVTMPPMPDASAAPAEIPVMLAAVNEGMVRLCGEKADGFLGHPFSTPDYLTKVALPALQGAIDEAGRARTDVEVVQSVIVRASNDEAEALRSAKSQIAFYATTRTYKPVLDLHGFGDVQQPLRDAHSRGDLDAMIDLVSDDMAHTYAVFGAPDRCVRELERWRGLADSLVLNIPWAFPGARSDDALDLVLGTFGR